MHTLNHIFRKLIRTCLHFTIQYKYIVLLCLYIDSLLISTLLISTCSKVHIYLTNHKEYFVEKNHTVFLKKNHTVYNVSDNVIYTDTVRNKELIIHLLLYGLANKNIIIPAHPH